MIKKNSIFKWGKEEINSFDFIKKTIIEAPSLTTHDFLKTFVLYTFSSDTSYAAVLTQLNDQNIEAPISFFSSNLQGAELNYLAMEKQAYVVFKALKHFRPFLLKTHTKIILPYSAVRQLLIQREVGEKRENWVTTLQEYDVEIHPAKIVKGQGLCRMLTGASHASTEEYQSNEIQLSEASLNDSQSQ